MPSKSGRTKESSCFVLQCILRRRRGHTFIHPFLPEQSIEELFFKRTSVVVDTSDGRSLEERLHLFIQSILVSVSFEFLRKRSTPWPHDEFDFRQWRVEQKELETTYKLRNLLWIVRCSFSYSFLCCARSDFGLPLLFDRRAALQYVLW